MYSLYKIRTRIDSLTPDFISRHFTWLSATVVSFLLLVILVIVVFFVPGIEPGTTLDWMVRVAAAIFTITTFASSIITLRRWWSTRDGGFTVRTSGESPSTESTEEETIGLSSRAEGFVESDEEIYDRAKLRLDGTFRILEDGEIQLDTDEKLPYDPKAMLYVFAARVAYDAGRRDSTLVSNQEIQDKIGGSRMSANIFFSKMGKRLDRNFDPDESLDDWEDEEIKAELNLRYADDTARYILGG